MGAGTAAPVEGSWPYAPVVEALADVCRRHPTLLDGLADHHREEIDRALAGTETPWAGGSSHQRLFVAVAELVRLASGTHGLLLTIDDIHDADDASLRLLHYVSRSTASERVCIVLSHRTTPMSETLAETRQSLLDRHSAAAIELGPLSDEEIALLVARHVDDASAEQRGRITALSRGIPFAVKMALLTYFVQVHVPADPSPSVEKHRLRPGRLPGPAMGNGGNVPHLNSKSSQLHLLLNG